ncbi:GNAT family N-acetyltransferase [Psychromonas sp. 14N.309.X.WAT.B.A12]|nr:GNAT family N-acetyltransferase [Psychromonas sp. 14N.309.X.WAT.B.A12]MDN2663062.1 GNAT family N-acetyltransferase [Psychromonas sp. 14N.309.X.WAT.B.A12]
MDRDTNSAKNYQIVTYCSARAKEIIDLFYLAVHSIDPNIYSVAQQYAWAPTPINYQKWFDRLSNKRPFLLLINDKVAGFMELESDGHIDCAYVHPDYQQQGVATHLLLHLVMCAKQSKIPALYVEASIIAKPLFQKLGFKVIKSQTVNRNNEALIQYLMQKQLV